ncbi:copper-translocating P-type ATPase [Brumimicrobium aurantiacum]|uniref:Cadmium-translocating P-type ATPase n=1 Tax=Brumimicrobium aurantiacum TaxID=1737063 RepID=A0A3E1EU80_9FLAO|nr:copper-translocating P-type ATPase [Brumimicrobium aurantiacum]RFC53107.1 cadmium-translocating P-type ATPase [Brumimicrobium aurantiacum]
MKQHEHHKEMDHSKMDHSGHGEMKHNHHEMMIQDFKRRFWVSMILTLPILALSPMIQGMLGVEWEFPGSNYVFFGLASIVYFYGGWPFLSGLISELKSKSIGMMTLIAVAISAAYFYSVAVIFGFEGQTFFWELATLIDVMLIGHWLEMRSILGASKALEALAELMPNEANLVEGSQTRKVNIGDLKEEDIILIRPGEKVPADGIIVEGESDLNESMLTGESKPVTKTVNEEVIGGAINGNGVIKVRVKGSGEEGYLSKVIDMVQTAQKQKSKTQRLADTAAKWLTIVALVLGFGTFFTWLALGENLAFSMERMVTVMVICCPHALGLAIPLVASISTSISAQNGLLIRNRTAFESSRKISTIVFDKTGTLTKGSHEITRMVSLHSDYTETDLLTYAAAVESPSEHHIAKGLARKAKEKQLDIPSVTDFKYTAGVGVSGKVNDKEVHAGGHLLLEQMNKTVEKDENEGIETKIFTFVDGELIGFITFADEIRESSFDAIKTLHNHNIKASLLTGDNEIVAKDVAAKLGLDDYMSEVLPDQKLEKIKELQAQDEFVAMVGDGVNDAPALAQADVGIAIGSGTDVAAETADIVLMDSNPKDIVNLILFGKATYKKMVQNLVWATGYNVIALPLATGFIPGLMISPAFGAALMSVSTIVCALNAQLLRRKIGRR